MYRIRRQLYPEKMYLSLIAGRNAEKIRQTEKIISRINSAEVERKEALTAGVAMIS